MKAKHTKKGHIICISGPSAVGKSTLIDIVQSRTNAKQAYSVTTRPLRDENDKRIPVTMEKFTEMQANNELIESIVYDGSAYGISRHIVNQILDDGMVAVLDCNESGVRQVLTSDLGEKITTVFLVCSPEQLLERQLQRNAGTLESRRYRLRLALDEIEGANNREIFQYVICNDDLEVAATKIVKLVNNIPIESDPFNVDAFKAQLQSLIDSL